MVPRAAARRGRRLPSWPCPWWPALQQRLLPQPTAAGSGCRRARGALSTVPPPSLAPPWGVTVAAPPPGAPLKRRSPVRWLQEIVHQEALHLPGTQACCPSRRMRQDCWQWSANWCNCSVI